MKEQPQQPDLIEQDPVKTIMDAMDRPAEAMQKPKRDAKEVIDEVLRMMDTKDIKPVARRAFRWPPRWD